MSRNVPQSQKLYTFRIWAADVPGYWGYMIVAPDGSDHVAGRRKGHKADVERHLNKCLDRLHDNQTAWKPLSLKGSRPQVDA